MTVRETLHALIEEERQFPHRTGAHLDECDRVLTELFALAEGLPAIQCPRAVQIRAQHVLSRAERAEVLDG